MDNENVIYKSLYLYTHTMEYYSAIKMKEILPLVTTWMHLEGIMLSGISQIWKDKYYVISLIGGTWSSQVKWWLTEAGERRKWGIIA